MNFKHKKAFTIIELIVVIAVIGILVLLAMPKFLGYVERSQVTVIRHDVKVAEGKMAESLINGPTEFLSWEDNGKNLDQLVEERKIYETEGLVKERKEEEKNGGIEYNGETVTFTDYKIIPKSLKKEIGTKLKGTFYTNAGGKVYYEREKAAKIDKPGGTGEETDENGCDISICGKMIPIAIPYDTMVSVPEEMQDMIGMETMSLEMAISMVLQGPGEPGETDEIDWIIRAYNKIDNNKDYIFISAGFDDSWQDGDDFSQQARNTNLISEIDKLLILSISMSGEGGPPDGDFYYVSMEQIEDGEIMMFQEFGNKNILPTCSQEYQADKLTGCPVKFGDGDNSENTNPTCPAVGHIPIDFPKGPPMYMNLLEEYNNNDGIEKMTIYNEYILIERSKQYPYEDPDINKINTLLFMKTQDYFDYQYGEWFDKENSNYYLRTDYYYDDDLVNLEIVNKIELPEYYATYTEFGKIIECIKLGSYNYNKTHLQLMIDKAQELNQEEYMDFSEISSALINANNVINYGSTIEIHETTLELIHSIANLIIYVDKTGLENVINIAQGLDIEIYVNYDDILYSLNNAIEVMEDNYATEREIVRATEYLQDCLDDLDEKPFVPAGYKIAKYSDFKWEEIGPYDENAYEAKGEKSKGYYIYKGNDEYVVIPNKIYGTAITSYYNMFESSKANLKGVANGNSNVTNMKSMFAAAKSTSMEIKHLNTSNVTDMSFMFLSVNFSQLDLTTLDTSKVTDISGMFAGTNTNFIGLENLDVSNVTNMTHTFGAYGKTTLDISGWNTSKVTNMNGMFGNGMLYEGTSGHGISTNQVPKINSITFGPGWITKNVKSMRNIFTKVPTQNVDLIMKNWDLSGLTSLVGLFQETNINNKVLNMDDFNINWSNITSMKNIFARGDYKVNFGNVNTSNVKDMSYMFYSQETTNIDVSKLNTSGAENFQSMFHSARKATITGLSAFDTSNVTDMANMFSYTNVATQLDLSNFTTNKVTTMDNMFAWSGASTLDLSSFRTPMLTSMDFMFDKSAAIILNVDNFDVSNVKRMNNTFAQMTKLKILDLNSFDFTHGVDTPGLFRASNSIETVYAKNQANANLLNSSFQKPAGLTVKIK